MLDKVLATGAVLRILRMFEMEKSYVKLMFRSRFSCFDQMLLYEYNTIQYTRDTLDLLLSSEV